MNKQIFYLSFFISFLIIQGCKSDPPILNLSESAYPKNIGKIILTKCAVTGCHNSLSKDAAGGLNLETWDKMFEGGRSGAVVIPYSQHHSPLFLFVNTFDELGVKMTPTMPVNREPLSKVEVLQLTSWIENGAPDAQGFVKFSNNPNRKKLYINNQGCDLVSVIDKETNLIMRNVKVGNKAQIESPHMVKVSPDGKFWYTCFSNSDVFQKFRTSDDSFVGEVYISQGNWNTFSITRDCKYAFIVDWASNGRIAVVDLQQMKLITHYQGDFIQPHGSILTPDDKFLYVTSQTGNFIYKVDVTDISYPEISTITLDGSPHPDFSVRLDPHFVEISPDGKSCYVVCQKSDELRIIDIETDKLTAVIKTGQFPQELVFSKSSDYAFVSCTEDLSTFPGKRGSITVFNYKTNSFVKSIYSGHQPHGIAVDDEGKKVYVAHRNLNSDGPAPHHVTECGGRNGYITIIDLARLELQSSRRYELSVDPYFIDIRN